MAKRDTIGNKIAPPRFLAFMGVLVVGTIAAAKLLHGWALGSMAGFDVAAFVFLASCVPLLGTREAAEIRERAAQTDANRIALLVITAIVMAVLMIAIAAEAVGRNPQPFTKVLIIVTLALAWLFSNTIYALHYAHLAYITPNVGCVGLRVPADAPSRLLGLRLFLVHLRDGVRDVGRGDYRNAHPQDRDVSLPGRLRLQHRRARLHDQPAGVELGGDLDLRRRGDLARAPQPGSRRRSGPLPARV